MIDGEAHRVADLDRTGVDLAVVDEEPVGALLHVARPRTVAPPSLTIVPVSATWPPDSA